MTRRWLLQACAGTLAVNLHRRNLYGQEQAEVYVCPMDPDVRSNGPGKCPRCGMTLEARIQEPVAYRMEMAASPANVPVGKPVELAFRITDPRTSVMATHFELVHEKLFHFFAVSQDLEWFLHDHPVLGADGVFRLTVTFPKAGMYEVFGDCYPSGGTPQWLPKFVYTQNGAGNTAKAIAKYESPQRDGDVEVTLKADPDPAYAGRLTNLFADINPGDGLELWLGTYAHAFVVSHDLVDAEHTHPVYFGKSQFQVFFPRPGNYRFWMQFQRKGTLHTVHFDIPVTG